MKSSQRCVAAAIASAFFVLVAAPSLAQTAAHPPAASTPQTLPARPAPAEDEPPQPEPPLARPLQDSAPTNPAVRQPRDLSPWSMFLAADIVVKVVMVSLAFASLVTWTIFFGKTMQLSRAQGRLRNALVLIGNARTLAEAQSDKLSSVSVRRRPHALSAAEYL